MPIEGARYRTVKRGGKTIRLAFKGPRDGGKVVEAKNLKTGATHTPAEFAEDRRRGSRSKIVSKMMRGDR